MSLVVLGLLLFGVLIYEPINHEVTKDIPATVTIKEAKYYLPSTDQQLIVNAPFLEAVSAALVREGMRQQAGDNGEAKRLWRQIVADYPGNPHTKFAGDWAGLIFVRAVARSNHSQRSTSGIVCKRPEPRGHSI